MSQPFRLTGDIKGGAEVEAHFRTAGDRVRKGVRREMLALGRDMQSIAAAKAPRGKGKRSIASRKFGPLAKSINPVVRNYGANALKLSIRPIAFYGLMVEAGYRKYAAGQRRWDGSHHRLVKTKAYSQGGGYVADSAYDVYQVRGGKGRERRELVAEGVRASRQTKRSIGARLGSARTSSFVSGQPFMEPMWREMQDRVQTRLDAAVLAATNGET